MHAAAGSVDLRTLDRHPGAGTLTNGGLLPDSDHRVYKLGCELCARDNLLISCDCYTLPLQETALTRTYEPGAASIGCSLSPPGLTSGRHTICDFGAICSFGATPCKTSESSGFAIAMPSKE